jgi:transposase InsO family protein
VAKIFCYECSGLTSISGLIRFKIVIHGFIDGKSRFVTGIHAASNNRADTVLELFHTAIQQHGTPRRMRGDHGTENLLVAQWMEDNQPGPHSYIWGW